MPMKKANENAKNAQPTQQGVVSSIQVLSGVPKFLVNGSLYDLNQVLSISASSSNR